MLFLHLVVSALPTAAIADSALPTATIADSRLKINVTGLGVVVGGVSERHASVAHFRGIPYAAPPLGKLRWQPPQPPLPWAGERDATAYGDYCMQAFAELYNRSGHMSESCLYLNVAVPLTALPARAKLPVMVWIHGGAYKAGQGNSPPMVPEALVSVSGGTVLCVTLNYRLNVFGFLGAAAVSAAAADGSSGNFGIADQRAALAWVRAHIAEFGGDPDAVTIFGQSAGGNSVLNHLAQPASFPLYHQAIVQSGAYDHGAMTMSQAESLFQRMLESTYCTDLACLAALDASVLAFAYRSCCAHLVWGPVVDGVALTTTPLDAIARGAYRRTAPVLLGSTRDEMAFFMIRLGIATDLDERGFNRYISAYFRLWRASEHAALKAIYANESSGYPYPPQYPASYSRWWWALMRVGTDVVPGLGPCAVRHLAALLLNGGSPAVFAYHLAHPTQAAYPSHPPGVGPGSVVVPHAADIPYAFGVESLLEAGPEAALARNVSTYWSNFARFGDPNGGAGATQRGRRGEVDLNWDSRAIAAAGATAWPRYSTEADALLRLDAEAPAGAGIHVQSHLRRQACDYMDSRLAHRPATVGLPSAWEGP